MTPGAAMCLALDFFICVLVVCALRSDAGNNDDDNGDNQQ